MSPKWLSDIIGQLEMLGGMFSAGVDVHAARQAAESKPFEVHLDENGTAHFRVSGPIMKSVPWYFDALGIEATSTTELAEAIQIADTSEQVKRISLDIDSPGGTLSGLQELADAIYGASKPTSAYAGDLAASAAYWIASQADEFTAGRGANIGSIGVYTVVEDISKALANEGVEVHVISSGGVKGGMVDGIPLSDEVKADIQREIDEAAELFIENIERKRGAFDRELASGKTWLGPTALKKGLIDGVETRRAYFNRLGAGAPVTLTASDEGALKKEVAQVSDEKNTSEALEAKFAELASRIEALEEDKVKAQARAEAAEASLKEVKAKQKADALAQAQKDGRVAPSMVSAMEKLAEVMDADEFAQHLAGFPVVTHDEAQGTSESEVVEANDYTKDELAVASLFNCSVEELREMNGITGIRVDGSLAREVK